MYFIVEAIKGVPNVGHVKVFESVSYDDVTAICKLGDIPKNYIQQLSYEEYAELILHQ